MQARFLVFLGWAGKSRFLHRPSQFILVRQAGFDVPSIGCLAKHRAAERQGMQVVIGACPSTSISKLPKQLGDQVAAIHKRHGPIGFVVEDLTMVDAHLGIERCRKVLWRINVL